MTRPDATPDDVWEWLLACLDCEQVHTYRPDPCHHGHDVWTWAADDGHAYRTRLTTGATQLHWLRAEWKATQ